MDEYIKIDINFHSQCIWYIYNLARNQDIYILIRYVALLPRVLRFSWRLWISTNEAIMALDLGHSVLIEPISLGCHNSHKLVDKTLSFLYQSKAELAPSSHFRQKKHRHLSILSLCHTANRLLFCTR